MEQARFILAITLSFIVLLVWQMMLPPPEEVNNQEVSSNQAEEKLTTEKLPVTPGLEVPGLDESRPMEDLAKIPQSLPNRDPRTITIETPLYVAQLTEKGAAFDSFLLKEYFETMDENSLFKEILSTELTRTSLINLKKNNELNLADVIYTVNYEGSKLSVNSPKQISFSFTSNYGIVFTKTYSFYPDTYQIGLTVSIANYSSKSINDSLLVSLKKPSPKKSTYIFEGPAALINSSLMEINLDDIEEQNSFLGKIQWIALEDRYFATGLIPKKVSESNLSVFVVNKVMEARLEEPSMNISPGTESTYEYDLFFGPKSINLLSKINNDFAKIIDFGWFDIIAKPFLHLMITMYRFLPNYGLAIILLTILVKLIFWPLGNKSYESMKEMKKIQPHIERIRHRYKDDRKKMNEEIMILYRSYKVNPLSGCLPMIIQIPVFIAFYRMLYQAIELRHAPFILWIKDLSAPDRLGDFGFSIPFMDDPCGIPFLTIVMGASMFIQQKMSPPPGDPSQAKIMMLMPIFMTVIFINFPAGLVLYWLVNNVASILQQHYINKRSN